MSENKSVRIKYKIRAVVEFESDIEDTVSLKESIGIEPFLTWFAEDVELKLGGICEVKEVQRVELEQEEIK